MSTQVLRLMTVIVPAGFLIGLELVRALIVEPRFGSLTATLIGTPVVLFGIVAFSVWIFHRLEAQQRRILEQNRALAALNAAGMSLTEDLTLETVLRRVAEQARALTGARYAALGVLGEDGQLDRLVTTGLSASEQARIDHLPRGEGLLGALIADPRPLRLADLTTDPRSAGFPPGHPPMKSFLGVPIANRGEAIGNLYLTDKVDAPEFDEQDEAAVVTLAAQAAIAIENARLYRRVGQLAVVEERERIGRELHDGVIQAIYGAGLGLDDALHTMPRDPDAGREKVRRVMGALDRTIGQIRAFIMDLEAREQPTDLGSRLADLVDEYRGETVQLELRLPERPLITQNAETAHQIIQIAREAISNAIRHSGAGQVRLDAEPTLDGLALRIVDDGRGFDLSRAESAAEAGHGRGLRNMHERAEQIGGRLDVETAAGRGTSVCLWLAA